MASLRLRLRIERNELPAVQTLWPIAPAQLRNTIAQLLESINRTFPLESSDWGYEDYAVLSSGYECLHYHTIETVIKDQDEITIRPLQYADVRARTITGRDQIARNGKHLLDGVPFGKPALRGPVRPEITIPGRKRKRAELEEEDDEGGDDAASLDAAIAALVGSASTSGNGDADRRAARGRLTNGDGDGDGSYAVQGEERPGSFTSELVKLEKRLKNNLESRSSVPTSARLQDMSKPEMMKALFESALGVEEDEDDDDQSISMGNAKAIMPYDEDEDDDESDNDFDPDADDFEDISSSASSDWEDDDDPLDEDSDEPFEGFPTSAPPTPLRDPPPHLTEGAESSGASSDLSSSDADATSLESHSDSDSDSDSLSDSSSSSSSSSSEEGDALEKKLTTFEKKPTTNVKHVGIPFEGKKVTKSRNARRRDTKELQHLQRKQILPASATLANLHAYKSKHLDRDVLEDQTGEATSASTLDHQPASKTSSAEVELAERRESLLAAIKEGGVDVTESKPREANHQTTNDAEEEDDDPPEELPISAPTDEEAEDMGVHKPRINKTVANRFIFGSLGVRNPKTADERKAAIKKLQDRGLRAAAEKGVPVAAKPDDSLPQVKKKSSKWRDVINLTAVEVTDATIILSTPPFPFRQRWDPQQQYWLKEKRKDDAHTYSQGGSKRQKIRGEYTESYDKYNSIGNSDALNYDDGVEMGDDPAAAQLQGEAAAGAIEDDFPALPVDLVTLASLGESEALNNDYITFTTLACDATTDWAPAFKTTTAKLLGQEEGVWKVEIAARDLPKKVYDSKGERVYGKFEAAGSDEDEGDEKMKELSWAELGEVRLLSR